jgi:hypothetical protein
MEREREDRIAKLEKRLDLMYVMSHTCDILKKITKDLRYKRTSGRKGNNERNERDCIHSESNTNTPSLLDPASNLDNPVRHAGTPHASPASHLPDPHSLTRTHTCPEDSPLPTSAACELDEPCSTGDTAVQNESSDSCGSSLRSSPPSEELGQDSREGIEGEEHPDPGGVGGMMGEDLGGLVQ